MMMMLKMMIDESAYIFSLLMMSGDAGPAPRSVSPAVHFTKIVSQNTHAHPHNAVAQAVVITYCPVA